MRVVSLKPSMFPEAKPMGTLRSRVMPPCEEIVYFTPAGSQICRGFKEQDELITSESKVQVVVSLGS